MTGPQSAEPGTTPGIRVAVVTVSYDSAAVLEPFLASIPAAASGTAVAVYVADNKPDSPARPAIERMTAEAGAHYVPMTGNLGYGHAVNAVVDTLPAGIPFVLVSNPDVVLHPGAVDALVATMDELPDAGAVGPKIVETDGSVYPSARPVPSLRNGIGHAIFGTFWPGNPWTRAYRPPLGEHPVRRDAGWLSGSCFLIRREVFDALDGFDTGYFMYFEDVDLGYRLGRLGRRNVYEPNAVVLHTGAHSTTGDSAARMLEAHHDSAKRFLARKYSGPLRWPVRTALSLGLTVRSALVRRKATR
ncbi:glycosyltransferase family 2 protein [Herbiconiux sp. 11R-BC]|uniref:glycosyltransferase family 2 protein n=1 Tax=Herbiconiux sp. 11R-BC TaxID=3111637 RepID=UPI003C0DF384